MIHVTRVTNKQMAKRMRFYLFISFFLVSVVVCCYLCLFVSFVMCFYLSLFVFVVVSFCLCVTGSPANYHHCLPPAKKESRLLENCHRSLLEEEIDPPRPPRHHSNDGSDDKTKKMIMLIMLMVVMMIPSFVKRKPTLKH